MGFFYMTVYLRILSKKGDTNITCSPLVFVCASPFVSSLSHLYFPSFHLDFFFTIFTILNPIGDLTWCFCNLPVLFFFVPFQPGLGLNICSITFWTEMLYDLRQTNSHFTSLYQGLLNLRKIQQILKSHIPFLLLSYITLM